MKEKRVGFVSLIRLRETSSCKINRLVQLRGIRVSTKHPH